VPKHQKASSATEVAKLAGVSQSAVSRTFTPGASVSPAMRKKVIAAAKKLDYQPNAIARSLITRRTNIVGLVMGDFVNPFYTEVLAELSAQLQQRHRHALLFTVPKNQSIDAVLPMILQYQVDAVVIAAATLTSATARECIQRGTPVILFNRVVPDTPAHVITVDNYGGGRTAADLLVRAGHRRFGYIAGHADTSTSVDRERGFYAGLGAHGIEDVTRFDGRYSYDGARDAGLALFAMKRRPDGIFCANDLMALGILDAARQRGIKVPQDVSVIGFDDIPQAGWSSYSLTTLRQPVDVMVSSTVDLLLSLREISLPKPTTCVIPPYLVVRGSARVSHVHYDLPAVHTQQAAARTDPAHRRR
jgi:DNA-binding LacI/PurR family transcriptional regulator